MSELIDKYQEPEFESRPINDSVGSFDGYYRPINDFEKDMLKNTYNANELLEKEQEELSTKQELTNEQQEHIKRRDYITKVKVIANNMLGKPPIANPSFFSKKDKALMIQYMEYVISNYNEDDLTKEFNEICTDKLFVEGMDYSILPIYNHNYNISSTPLYDA